MLNNLNNPYADILFGVLMLACGVLMFLYRNVIGDFTDYYTGKYGYVDKPTPGCLLIPFALVLIVGGVMVIIKSLGQI